MVLWNGIVECEIVQVLDLDGNICLVDTSSNDHIVEEVRVWAGDDLADTLEKRFDFMENESEERFNVLVEGFEDELSGHMVQKLEYFEMIVKKMEEMIKVKNVGARKKMFEGLENEIEELRDFLGEGFYDCIPD